MKLWKQNNAFSSNYLGVTTLSKGGYFSNRLFAPFAQCGRAIHATSVASFYPSRSFTNFKNILLFVVLQVFIPNLLGMITKYMIPASSKKVLTGKQKNN
jgi:hypothetical protein